MGAENARKLVFQESTASRRNDSLRKQPRQGAATKSPPAKPDAPYYLRPGPPLRELGAQDAQCGRRLNGLALILELHLASTGRRAVLGSTS